MRLASDIGYRLRGGFATPGLFDARTAVRGSVLLDPPGEAFLTTEELGCVTAERRGFRKAAVATARKIAVLMLTIWKSGIDYQCKRRLQSDDSWRSGLSLVSHRRPNLPSRASCASICDPVPDEPGPLREPSGPIPGRAGIRCTPRNCRARRAACSALLAPPTR